MKRPLLFLFLMAMFGCSVVSAQELVPPESGEDAEFERLIDEREASNDRLDPNEELIPPMDDSVVIPQLPEPDFDPSFYESTEAASERVTAPEKISEGEVLQSPPHLDDMRSRRRPFQHLSQLPGQYGGDWFRLLTMKYVRNEIELVDEQKKAIHEVSQKYKKRTRELLRQNPDDIVGMPGEENTESFDQLNKKLARFRTEAVSELKAEVLLPQQVQRLKELDFQLRVKSRGIIATLKDKELGLNVSDSQLESIESRAHELVEEYDLLMRSFKIDFQEQILNQLKDSQKAKVKKLMGPEMQIKDDEGDQGSKMTAKIREAALEKLQQWRDRQ